MKSQSYIYIMGNTRPTLYIGVTTDLVKRVHEHKNDDVAGFTSKYHLHHLLYYEVFDNLNAAIEREKRLKHWKRDWKLDLIRQKNPLFKDLYSEII